MSEHSHDHAHDGDTAHDDHGLAHTTPVSLLIGILAVLLVLTILTVSVTSFDMRLPYRPDNDSRRMTTRRKWECREAAAAILDRAGRSPRRSA